MLDRLPVEIVERIVTKIPDTDLIAASKKMLRNGMVVDPQERETIEHALSEHRWGGNP
ncbi:hypothetical protein GLOIN_2v1877605 [Rhizophagus irregularis DAOM 181602=DAOM 197198]|uniref:F-box domain-containing protein n=1 Tax=Rhizophagus irregularis (strain DAOM 181602 / DAOM 197198 / MUCL 43194) TaxID=747089 RepID=A0A2P4PVA4_RHIID|nr:hypothetical protein GLOIN_2v1877605 [Rhizophagus irregularis DAOM 181602=DAOM 197198]POG69333.1 hypothetical protein GLOIN_2v1877605 [Rhizophagus irregularis DAOM 181602=DAOM 197198]|eukprot:XP_025176199.1 hypothetical protein GLOIN_2v1877605 [Rhizophagus irregularis DAOM 181602=DAOM 197198]